MGRHRSAGASLAILACCMVLSGCRAEPMGGPVAAAMDTKGRVVLVDLQKARVADTVRLTTWPADICAEPSTGSFVTAQSGGVGTDADDRAAVIDVRGDRRVRYVKLPRPNPNGVERIGDGLVVVDHGWEEKAGLFACTVDVRTRTVVTEGHIPDNNVPLRQVGGVLWSSGIDVFSDVRSLRKVDPKTLRSVEVQTDDHFMQVECATPDGMAGYLIGRDRSAQLARFDPATGAVAVTRTVDFADGPGRMVRAGGRLVVLDFSEEDLSCSGCRLMVFDAASLEFEREVRLRGGPSDIDTWGDQVVAVNWIDQTLQVVDPATGEVTATVELPPMERLPLRVSVLDR